jgi:DNA transformation protein and related proteins
VKNIGPVSAGWLAAVGIRTLQDLERVGPLDAWRRVDDRFPGRASVTLLYALEAALLDIPWNDLPPEVKRRLAARARADRAARASAPATGR